MCAGRSTGECWCSSLQSDSRVLVPVSLPSDESKRLVDPSKCFESFRGGIDKGFDRSIEFRDFSSLQRECAECRLAQSDARDLTKAGNRKKQRKYLFWCNYDSFFIHNQARAAVKTQTPRLSRSHFFCLRDLINARRSHDKLSCYIIRQKHTTECGAILWDREFRIN